MPLTTLASVLDRCPTARMVVPPTCPYVWNGDTHNIAYTRSNIPLIAMAMIHDGGTLRDVTDVEYEAAATVAGEEGATAAEIEAFEKRRIVRDIFNSLEQYSNWYLILVACAQVRDLTSSNIENFTKMCKAPPMPGIASQYIAYFAATREELITNETIRDKFMNNKFFEYHTTGSSTPALCQRAIEESGDLGVFDSDEVEDIEAAVENAHDLSYARAIETVTLVKARAVLEACGGLPDTWYMGKHALEKYSSKKYASIVKYLKKIFDIQTGIVGLEDMPMATLVTNLRALLSGNLVTSEGTSGEHPSDPVGDEEAEEVVAVGVAEVADL